LTLPFPLSSVLKVLAYKRDELTTDLICFDVTTDAAGGARTWLFHEEQPGFEEIARELALLPGFLTDWRDHVVKPAFASCEIVLYSRPIS